jgi:hypothetical protein
MIVRHAVWMLLALAMLTGCGSGLKLVQVEGTLTLDGEPLALKGIFFVPEQGTPEHGAAGYSNKEGKYRLMAIVSGVTRDMVGVPPGRYKVTVSEPMIPISEKDFEKPESPRQSDDPAPAIGFPTAPQKQQIPRVYTSSTTTPLTLEVPENGGTLDIKLESKPG